MAKRLGIRVARLAGFLVLLDFVLFGLFDLLPEAPLRLIGIFALDPELLESARRSMGLQGPWYARFAGHWIDLVHGSMGTSLVGSYPIAPVLWERAVRSLPIWIGSLCMLPIAFALASIYATRGWSRAHRAGLALGQFAAAPQFLGAVVAFVIWASLFAGTEVDTHAQVALAVLSCGLFPSAVLFTAAARTLSTMAHERWVDTYLAMGLRWSQARRHLLNNAVWTLRPLLARLTLWILIGTIFAETVFGLPGFGDLLVEAVRAGDLNVVRHWMLVAGVAVLVVTEVERL